jgi:hypothetical protein
MNAIGRIAARVRWKVARLSALEIVGILIPFRAHHVRSRHLWSWPSSDRRRRRSLNCRSGNWRRSDRPTHSDRFRSAIGVLATVLFTDTVGSTARDGALGCCIGGDRPDNAARRERGEENDTASFRQDRKQLLDEKEGGANVDGEQPVEILTSRHIQRRRPPSNPIRHSCWR